MDMHWNNWSFLVLQRKEDAIACKLGDWKSREIESLEEGLQGGFGVVIHFQHSFALLVYYLTQQCTMFKYIWT